MSKKEKLKFNIGVFIATSIIIAYGWLLGYITASIKNSETKKTKDIENKFKEDYDNNLLMIHKMNNFE